MEKHIKYLCFFLLVTLSWSKACDQGHLWLDSSCVPMTYIQGCYEYNPSGYCQTCSYGYQRSSDGLCYQKLQKVIKCCIDYNQDGTCRECQKGLLHLGESCIRSSMFGCLTIHGDKCTNCGQGYHLKQGSCYKDLQGCILHDDLGYCITCEKEYMQQKGICIKQIRNGNYANCLVSNPNGCITCASDYYLNDKKQCQHRDYGCIYFQGRVQGCQAPWKLSQDGKCYIEGCYSYDHKGCTFCQQGYENQNGNCQIEHCQESYKGKCLICKQGFGMAYGKCVPNLHTECIVCPKNYRLNQDNNCIPEIRGCLSYQANKCLKCQTGMYIRQGHCQYLACMRYDHLGCRECHQPFFRNNQYKCQIQFCLEYGSQGCQKCQEGYYSQNGKCVRKDDKCLKYYTINEYHQECKKCYKNFMLWEGSCRFEIRGCEKYAFQGCVKCKKPFVLASNRCHIENCDHYSHSGCKYCAHNYRLSTKGLCHYQIQNCETFDQQTGECTLCAYGYGYTSQKECLMLPQNCRQFNQNQQCGKCKKGYVAYGYQCIQLVSNCQSYHSQGCQKCEQGYHMQHSRCHKNDYRCLRYSSVEHGMQECIRCDTGSVLVNAECQNRMPGCVYEQQKCVGCVAPWTYNSTYWACQILGCWRYDQNGCTKCRVKFELVQNRCQIDYCTKYAYDSCLQCGVQAYLFRGICYPKNPRCAEYNTQGQCKQCVTSYKLSQGDCIFEDQYCLKYTNGKCSQCILGTHLNREGVCERDQYGCSRYSFGNCVGCNPPFYLTKGQCQINFCEEYDAKGCLTCTYPFVLNAYARNCEISYCNTYNFDHTRCQSCQFGYVLAQGICLLKDPSCMKYNSYGECVQCHQQYQIASNGLCEISIEKCVTYNTQQSRCITCQQGYFSNCFGFCEKLDPACTQYVNGICARCQDDHYLYRSKCVLYNSACLKYYGKDCRQCIDGSTDPHCQTNNTDRYYPIDISESADYLKYLSPSAHMGAWHYSSVLSKRYTNEVQGWKAATNRAGQYMQLRLKSPLVFYRLTVKPVEDARVTKFHISYSYKESEWIQINQLFQATQDNQYQVDIKAILADKIRIHVVEYEKWPAAKVQLYHLDWNRNKPVKGLTFKELSRSIVEVIRDRFLVIDYNRYYLTPDDSCKTSWEGCFTGFELAQPKNILKITVEQQKQHGMVNRIKIKFSTNGKDFQCLNDCQGIDISEEQQQIDLKGLYAKAVRIYPDEWQEIPQINVRYDYQ